MTAFAYEQCHLLDEAESEARSALEMRRKEPWAQHALAHVLLTRGRIDEGARFLEEMRIPGPVSTRSCSRTSVAPALFYLSQGATKKRWSLRSPVLGNRQGLLAGSNRRGIAARATRDRRHRCRTRWQDLADHLVARAHDTVLPS